jgi:hypothetical protein
VRLVTIGELDAHREESPELIGIEAVEAFPSLRSWEEGRRSPNSHTAAILEKFLLDHPTVERPKK